MTDITEILHLQGVYLNPLSEIINPLQNAPVTKYFLDNWVPELGPNLMTLILQLRKHCLFNQNSQDGKNLASLSLKQLTKECGLSERTIRRELSNPLSKKFITASPNYRYDETLKKKVRTPNTYEVALDDPIHPTDEDKFLQLIKKREAIAQVQTVANDLPAKLADRSKNSVDNPPPTGQIGRHIYDGQIGRHNVYNTDNVKMNVNVQGQNVHKPNEANLSPSEVLLLRKILSVTRDEKSESFFRQVVKNCSQASVEKAIEDIKTYAASGRKVKNMGALFTSRIKSHDKYFQK